MQSMKLIKRARPQGFSLIEVLVSVVVLSFGILALTALQSNLIKASADAKAQSVALALAKDKLEELRSYSSITAYQNLTSSASAETLTDSSGNLSGTNYTRSWTIKRYAVPAGGNTFAQYTTLTGTLPNTYAPNIEFKTIEVRVNWVDAAGQAQTIAVEDAIAGLDPSDSAKLQRVSGARSRGPKVIIFDPSSDPGVIPIAVGNGSDTAATNPKPVVAAQTSGEDTIETRFDVLTYSALSGGKALAQAKVETTVVGCTCTRGVTSTPAYRPTYWNGLRYVAPQLASYNAPARAANVTQSRYCTECCRDHHDPTGTAGAKFSPRRSSHTHYRLQAGTLVAAGAGEDYLEACRLIRVDGIFDVAADMSNDYMNLLDTGTGANDNQFGTNPVPLPAAVTGYQAFVLDYLQQRYAPTTVPSAPTSSPLSHPFNSRTSPSANTIAASHGVQTPRPSRPMFASNDRKWLHSRGVYVDFLEPEALDAIGDARSTCQDGTDSNTTLDAAEIRDCVLRVLPFTTINLTELATWRPISGSSIKVTNANFDDSITSPNPVRGLATPLGLTTPTNPNADAIASSSNSGVAISPEIDPDDVAGVQTATQPFAIQGGSPTPGGQFRFGTSTNYSINNASPRTLDFYYGSNNVRENCGVSGTSNPVLCEAGPGETLPAVVTLQVGNYNKTGTDGVNNPCDNGPAVDMPYIVQYDITSFTSTNAGTTFSNMTVVNPNKPGALPTGEYTTVTATTIGPVVAGVYDSITANMSSPSYLCPSNYPGSGQSYACFRSGNKDVPQWSTTYVACPSSAGSPPNFP
jgi:type IV pilus modification protein PilV